MKKYYIIILLLFFIYNCSSVKMEIKTYSDPEKNLTKIKKFTIVPTNKENPLLEKELLFMVKNKMLEKGYIYDSKNPDILIAMIFYCGPFQYYVPQETITLPKKVPGKTKTYSGWIDGEYYWGTEKESDRIEYETYTYGGYTASAYYRNITLYFVNPDTLSTNNIETIWQGVAESSGSSSDIRKVAPYLIEELLFEFPTKSGKSSKRERYME